VGRQIRQEGLLRRGIDVAARERHRAPEALASLDCGDFQIPTKRISLISDLTSKAAIGGVCQVLRSIRLEW